MGLLHGRCLERRGCPKKWLLLPAHEEEEEEEEEGEEEEAKKKKNPSYVGASLQFEVPFGACMCAKLALCGVHILRFPTLQNLP